MTLFTDRNGAGSVRQLGIIEELELLWKRVSKVALAAPLLLLVGFGTGRVTNRALELPERTPVRLPTADEVPRVHLEALSHAMERIRGEGERTVEYVGAYQEHVAPVERVLRRRGMPEERARRIAWPLVEQANRHKLDVATVMSIMYVESNGKPDATSSVGARGLMQVMPSWAGRWRGCGRDLYAIEDNLCNGTSILAWYLRHHGGDERRALLGYNGCVKNPTCHTYPDKVDRLRRQIARELHVHRPRTSVGAAAAP